MKIVARIIVRFARLLDLGSALAVRLTKITGKSKVPLHPKHLLTSKPWFTKYLSAKDLVLDLGCGNGQNTLKAAKIAKRVTGVEIDQRLLTWANFAKVQKKVKNVQFEEGNLEKKLIFHNNTFDKVMLLDVLEHLVHRDQILAEVKRVLKSSGLLFLGVPNSQTSWKKFQRSADVCSFSDPDHKIEFSKDSIKRLLAKHGFKIIHFGYGKYDVPARGLIDIIGAFSLNFYKWISHIREQKIRENPGEASGFEIVASLP